MEFESILRLIALYAIPGIFAITLHEAAHGYAARHFGDLTAYHAGRITLNPVRHVDPVGTLLVPILILAVSGGSGSRFSTISTALMMIPPRAIRIIGSVK